MAAADNENWNDETKQMIVEQYKEFGQWARHYSVVRMTVGTFIVTTCFAIMNYRWDSPDISLAAFVLLFFLMGCAIFLMFSHLTFKRMREQIEQLNIYRRAELKGAADDPANAPILKPRMSELPTGRYCLWGSLDGFPVVIIVTILFLTFFVVWISPIISAEWSSHFRG
jgi:hypothetical protein